jgi:NADH-quinone oxidoreductase subunit J
VLACGFAVAVVLSDNVVRMALYLVLSLGATAGLFFLAGAEFIGAMQLMIYVGGTLVLLVFGVMLTAQAPFVSIKTAAGTSVLAGVVAMPRCWPAAAGGLSVKAWRGRLPASWRPAATPIGMALVGVRVDEPAVGARRRTCGPATCCRSRSSRSICSWCSSVPPISRGRSGGDAAGDRGGCVGRAAGRRWPACGDQGRRAADGVGLGSGWREVDDGFGLAGCGRRLPLLGLINQRR